MVKLVFLANELVVVIRANHKASLEDGVSILFACPLPQTSQAGYLRHRNRTVDLLADAIISEASKND